MLIPFLSRKVVAFAPACGPCRKSHRWSTELFEATMVLAAVGLMGTLYYLFISVDALQPLVDAVPKFIGKRLGFIVALDE